MARCISCFSETGDDAVCRHCGFDLTRERKSFFLPAFTVLQERYEIGEILQSDKNCICYKALDKTENRIVEVQEYCPREAAVRQNGSARLLPLSAEREVWMQKNMRSIRSGAQTVLRFVRCNGLMHIYDVFDANGTVYIVNEYLEGLTLEDYLKDCGGCVDVPTALSVILPVLDGLSVLHEAGLVHRAISPRNIIITTENAIKIYNFTFLREASPFKESEMTVYYAPGYAPFEQYVSKERRGAYSDIYSVGAVLYKMLTGHTPPDAVARRSEDTLCEDLQNAKVPQNIMDAMIKAMDMEKESRFDNVEEFRQALFGETKEVPKSKKKWWQFWQ